MTDRETMHCLVQLTSDERAARAMQAADLTARRADLELADAHEREKAKEDATARQVEIRRLALDSSVAARAAASGYEHREVEVRWELEGEHMIARRIDTGERVGARAATPADRQVTIGVLREERTEHRSRLAGVDYQGVRVEGGGVEMRRVEYPTGALVGDASRLIEGTGRGRALPEAIPGALDGPRKSPRKRGAS
jgi:hypothetical protein